MRSVTKQNADLQPNSGANPHKRLGGAHLTRFTLGKDTESNDWKGFINADSFASNIFLVAGLTTLQQHNTALMFIRIRVIEAKIRSPCEIIIKRKITINPDWDQADYTQWTLGHGVRSDRGSQTENPPAKAILK